jgi:hypothetical protein
MPYRGRLDKMDPLGYHSAGYLRVSFPSLEDIVWFLCVFDDKAWPTLAFKV